MPAPDQRSFQIGLGDRAQRRTQFESLTANREQRGRWWRVAMQIAKHL
jgi:hypothetical protein